MIDRNLLRLSATLLFVGELLSILVGILHPSRENPNDHQAVFADYAASGDWITVYLGQFIGMGVIIAGLLALYFAVDWRSGAPEWAARFGAVSAVVALGLYGVLQAVDGVALKHAVDAWASAPGPEKAARLASAETVRWLEWGVRSYQSFMLGISLVLFGVAAASAVRIPRPIGYLMGVSGLAYVVQSFVLGAEGFSPNNTVPQLLAYIAFIAWSIWLLIVGLRSDRLAQASAG